MKRIFLLAVLGFVFNHVTYASPFGISYSQIAVGQDPDHLKGFRTGITYQPCCLIWTHLQFYFDVSYGHYWVSSRPYHSLNSVALAPYIRYWLAKKPYFSPFVEMSIAPAYVSRTRIGDANLGMHFIFQDQASIGAAFFPERKLYAMLSFYHYSNGSFCSNNQGMTAPVTLTLGYRF